jgi:hypothetical protein
MLLAVGSSSSLSGPRFPLCARTCRNSSLPLTRLPCDIVSRVFVWLRPAAAAVVTFVRDLGNVPAIIAKDITTGLGLAVTETTVVCVPQVHGCFACGAAPACARPRCFSPTHDLCCSSLRILLRRSAFRVNVCTPARMWGLRRGSFLCFGWAFWQGSRVTYGELPGSPLQWDAEMVRGCLCDGRTDYSRMSANGDVGYFQDYACKKRGCRVPGAGCRVWMAQAWSVARRCAALPFCKPCPCRPGVCAGSCPHGHDRFTTADYTATVQSIACPATGACAPMPEARSPVLIALSLPRAARGRGCSRGAGLRLHTLRNPDGRRHHPRLTFFVRRRALAGSLLAELAGEEGKGAPLVLHTHVHALAGADECRCPDRLEWRRGSPAVSPSPCPRRVPAKCPTLRSAPKECAEACPLARASGVSYTLEFRTQVTAPIADTATAQQITTALEALDRCVLLQATPGPTGVGWDPLLVPAAALGPCLASGVLLRRACVVCAVAASGTSR